MNQFRWQPKRGMDPDALARLRKQFPRPGELMGEAWFIGGQRRMFPELNGNLALLDVNFLHEVLREIAGGTSSFGPFREWDQWFHYLLAGLLTRAHDKCFASLLESLMNAFFAIYPQGILHLPYKRFEADVLSTLGQCMMEPQCWNGEDVALETLLENSYGHPERVWFDLDASGDLSASMFFCLKYLPVEQIGEWLQSIVDITSPVWRMQLMTWLVGANGMLTGAIGWPSQLQEGARPNVGWEWSHCLRPELAVHDSSAMAAQDAFLPHASRTRALAFFHDYFNEDRFLQWLSGIDGDAELANSLYDMPDRFEQLYVNL